MSGKKKVPYMTEIAEIVLGRLDSPALMALILMSVGVAFALIAALGTVNYKGVELSLTWRWRIALFGIGMIACIPAFVTAIREYSITNAIKKGMGSEQIRSTWITQKKFDSIVDVLTPEQLRLYPLMVETKEGEGGRLVRAIWAGIPGDGLFCWYSRAFMPKGDFESTAAKMQLRGFAVASSSESDHVSEGRLYSATWTRSNRPCDE